MTDLYMVHAGPYDRDHAEAVAAGIDGATVVKLPEPAGVSSPAARSATQRTRAPRREGAPKLLDLCCGGGGASMGYYKAGFDVVGVDVNPMPRYPFEFHQADALEYLIEHGRDFDVVHASPPCQPYTRMSICRPGSGENYDDRLIEPIRELCRELAIPYVIENAVGAPLWDPIELCGHMFGLQLYRHRWFECSEPIPAPEHVAHTLPGSPAGRWKPGTIMTIAGHIAPISVAKDAMGIGWMTRDELVEAIPPAYTQYIGEQMLSLLTVRQLA
jgi:DNA (cytosine-5)-methyltransferase 1